MNLGLTPWGRLESLYERELVKLFKAFQTHALSRHTLLQLASNKDFLKAAFEVARRMGATIARVNAVSWRSAVIQGSKAREIYSALQLELNQTGERRAVDLIIAANALEIRSIPLHLAEQVTKLASSYQQRGLRGKALEKELRSRIPGLTANKIKLIARTEIGKSESALTRARSEEVGVNWYQWSTSQDQRVRPSHRNLELVLVSWDDAPQPEALIGQHSTLGKGAPGEFPNCRCAALPLVSLDEVKWPARVYRRGSIIWMTRAQFQKMAKYPKAA